MFAKGFESAFEPCELLFPCLLGFRIEVFVVDSEVAGLLFGFFLPEDGAAHGGFVIEPGSKVAGLARPDGAEINLFEVAYFFIGLNRC